MHQYLFIPISVVIFNVFIAGNMFGQDIAITTTSTCVNANEGTINLYFNPSLLNDYNLPFQAEWENISDGEYGIITITTLNYTIENLSVGEYEIVIALDDQCEIYSDTEVQGLLAPSLSIEASNPTSNGSCEDGWFDLTINGGNGPYDVTYYWEPNGIGAPMIIYEQSGVSGLDGSEDFNEGIEGDYKITVIDTEGCVESVYRAIECEWGVIGICPPKFEFLSNYSS